MMMLKINKNKSRGRKLQKKIKKNNLMQNFRGQF